MAAYKETPRQKMIAMMYLVLTAMLALNVSKEVIDAFAVVNDSIEKTNESFDDKINQTYAKFEFQYNLNKEKVEPLWQKAQEIKRLSEDMRTYLAAVRDTTIIKTENKTMEEIKRHVAEEQGVEPEEVDQIPVRFLEKKNDYDKVSNYFVPNLDKPREKGKAQEVRRRFVEYREKMLALVHPNQREDFRIGPDFDRDYYNANGQAQTWEENHFYHTIMAAAVTIMNKMITEVNNAEFDMLNHFYSSISEEDFKFSTIEAKVIPKRNYVLKGEEYVADVFVAAYDTTQRPEVYIQPGVDSIVNLDQATRVETNTDLVRVRMEGRGIGENKYAGMVRLQAPDGTYNEYHFKDSFEVGQRAATVSATKMNVFYKGVDNPVSISVPGVPTSQIRPSINVGTLKSEGRGIYTVTIPGDINQDAVITVNAVVDGEETFFESFDYRVKRIPDPIPSIGGAYTSGRVPRNFLITNSLIAKSPEGFDFDYNFMVTSFDMWFRGEDGYDRQLSSNSYDFTEDMLTQFDRLPVNSRVTFENITVKAPEGERTLPTTISIIIR